MTTQLKKFFYKLSNLENITETIQYGNGERLYIKLKNSLTYQQLQSLNQLGLNFDYLPYGNLDKIGIRILTDREPPIYEYLIGKEHSFGSSEKFSIPIDLNKINKIQQQIKSTFIKILLALNITDLDELLKKGLIEI